MNYSFIFGFKEGTELGYGEVLLCGFCLSVLALASVLANLDMEMDPITQDYKAVTELLPLGLVVVRIYQHKLLVRLLSPYISCYWTRYKMTLSFAACACHHALPV